MNRIQHFHSIAEYLHKCFRGVPLGDDKIVYSIHVLSNPKILRKGESLSEMYLEARQINNLRTRRQERLQEAGDIALCILILFRGYASSRGLVELYEGIGQSAYTCIPSRFFVSFGQEFGNICQSLGQRMLSVSANKDIPQDFHAIMAEKEMASCKVN